MKAKPYVQSRTVGDKITDWVILLALLAACTYAVCGCAPFREFTTEDVPAAVPVAVGTFLEQAPTNPADLTGWIIAALGAVAAGATYIIRRRRPK